MTHAPGPLVPCPISLRLFACSLILASLAGCSGMNKADTVEEGTMAAQRAAQADAHAQTEAGVPGMQGTSSSIPSLVPGEGRVQLPVAITAPPTAPPPDKFDENDAGHFLARCRDRAARQQWFDAIGDCRRSAELSPSSIEPWFELMRLLVNLQSYADAEDAARRVLAVSPDDPVAFYYLAWSHRGRSQYPQAVTALERAIALDPKRIEFVQALAVTYRLSGNYGKAIATLERAQAMKPDDVKTQNMLVEIRRELAEKLSPYQRLAKEKDSVENQAALGFVYQKFGLSQRALTAYDTALSKIPAPIPDQERETKQLAAQIYYNRGVVYRDLGRPELGEPAIWQAMQLDPSLASFAWYYIGLCRYDMGKYDTSIEALRKSVDLAPDVVENRAALADAFAKAGKTQLAAEQRNAVSSIQAREAAEKAATARDEAAAAESSPRPPSMLPPIAPAVPAPASTSSSPPAATPAAALATPTAAPSAAEPQAASEVAPAAQP